MILFDIFHDEDIRLNQERGCGFNSRLIIKDIFMDQLLVHMLVDVH